MNAHNSSNTSLASDKMVTQMSKFYIAIIGCVYADNIHEATEILSKDSRKLEEVSVLQETVSAEPFFESREVKYWV